MQLTDLKFLRIFSNVAIKLIDIRTTEISDFYISDYF